MRLVARLRSGRLVYYAAGVFYLDGNGSISRARMSKLDKQGAIEWLDDDLRLDFRTQTGNLGSDPRAAAILHDDGHRFNPLAAFKKVAIAAALFVMFWTVVAAALVFNSARIEAGQRVVSTHETEALKARTVLGAYYDLVVATEQGVSYSRYAPALERARAARAEFDPGNAVTIEIAKRLDEADRMYVGADDIWQLQGGKDASAQFASYKTTRGDLGLTEETPNGAVQELWARGYDQVNAALAALELYEGVDEVNGHMQPDVTIADISAVLWERISRRDTPKPPDQPTRTASREVL